MAKSDKKKFEKDTRLLLERISDMVKPSKNGKFKFRKSSRKIVKNIKRNCCHWLLVKGKAETTVQACPDRPGYWKCGICKAEFPMAPFVKRKEPGEKDYTPGYTEVFDDALGAVNQILLWETGLGGNKDDLRTMLELKRYLPKMLKIAKHVPKIIEKRTQKDNRNTGANVFDMYNGWNYRR